VKWSGRLDRQFIKEKSEVAKPLFFYFPLSFDKERGIKVEDSSRGEVDKTVST